MIESTVKLNYKKSYVELINKTKKNLQKSYVELSNKAKNKQKERPAVM